MKTHKICFFAGTHGNWGGASRVLFTNLRLLDRNRFTPIVLLSAHGPAETLMDELGIQYKVWGPLTEPGRHLEYIRAVLRTCIWLRQQHIDLVHMNRANHWRPAELLATRICKRPVVTHFHTVNLDHAPATRWSTAIAAVSSYVAQHSDTLGVPASVIYNTVDLGRFSKGNNLRSRFDIEADQIVVSFIGQIRKIKGIEDFVSMARQVAGEGVRFLIAGECRDKSSIGDAYTKEELQNLISSDPRIRYCGYIEQVEDIFHSSDIVVVPSRWEEPFGLVCIEAAAAGLPVVATRTGGLPEVVADGITGLLVEAGDIQAMTRQVQRLIDDAHFRAALGKAARDRVEHEFAEKPIHALEDLYESLLRRSSD
ncbi:glycosyltransferase family 4 protein [Methylocaldum sp.]|uniref:glycosyltransferase family 4 protein n=1 Tax=Methylocaldum sp. TaxID=1969727 RepID=UPI002D40AFBC|nr:glycosyltransferase family 4 protein [Methylocaldum sp.]HYE35929.1 glycosyltransferase family 4 protein [Methylocaldum sp.]